MKAVLSISTATLTLALGLPQAKAQSNSAVLEAVGQIEYSCEINPGPQATFGLTNPNRLYGTTTVDLSQNADSEYTFTTFTTTIDNVPATSSQIRDSFALIVPISGPPLDTSGNHVAIGYDPNLGVGSTSVPVGPVLGLGTSTANVDFYVFSSSNALPAGNYLIQATLSCSRYTP